MKRRAILQNIILATGSLVTLPAWTDGWEIKNLRYTGWFTPDETNLIGAISSTIIPDGKDPGALKVGVHKFLISLFEDCYYEDIKKNIRSGLIHLDNAAKDLYGKSFLDIAQKEKENLLLLMASSPDKSLKDFFSLLKSETIRGYTTSKEVIVKYFSYKVVPGYWYGCVNVNG